MLDRNFNLKIADFGFSSPADGKAGESLLRTRLGTSAYMAPEIHLGVPYSGQRVDLFTSAIIIFTMLSQRLPFRSATLADPHYYLYAVRRPEMFWEAHEEEFEDKYSDDFKDLFERMVAFNPEERPELEEVLGHEWMRGAVATEDEV